LLFCYTESVKKARTVKQKVMGRPRTGTTPLMGFRASDELRGKIVHWAEFQPDAPKLSEAVRRLVELGLTVKTKAKPTGRASAAIVSDLAAESIDSLAPPVKAPRPVGKLGRKLRARELATKAIEKIIDPAAPPEERTQRRRRLTKGPTEFRNVRVDQPKAKGK
jgi:hypothetical protein